MSVLFVLIGVSLAMAGSALAAFAWGVRDGQMDDLATPASRILVETEEDSHS